MKKRLFLLFIVALFAACSPAPEEATPDLEVVVQATFQALTLQAPPVEQTGSIAGSLTFPSERIPPLLVVAFNTNTGQYYWVQTTEDQSTYQIDNIPVGTYTVFAYLLPDGSMIGAYDQFYVCGLKAECTDVSLIEVDVQAGVVTQDITPGDWYSDSTQWPSLPNDPSIPNVGIGNESASSEKFGSIAGNLSYPSSYIPAQTIVAFDVNSPSYYYVMTAENQSSYRIDNLPPGTYYIVAYVHDSTFSAGYSQSVLCGLSVECSDHSLVPVSVKSGEVTNNIHPGDWYAPPNAFPASPLP